MFSRTVALIGAEGMEKLKNAHVAVFGLGGVGGYAVEALARSGVGALTLVDNDTVSVSNLNRQIIALHSTVGELKTDVFAKRIMDINPDCKVQCVPLFVLPENIAELDFSAFDYVVDAIDTVSGKIAIIERAKAQGVPVISAMGTGNKLDAQKLEITELEKTSVCPLARVMRRELKKRGVNGVKVVYSKEEAITPSVDEKNETKKPFVGSVAFVPSVAGLLIAGEVVKDLI